MSLSTKARRRIVVASTSETYGKEIADAIDHGKEAIALYHEVVGGSVMSVSAPGQTATPVAYGSTVGNIYTPNQHAGYRVFKISTKYVDSPTIHIHWTKSSNVNELNKAVKWRVSYTVYDGTSDNVNVTPTVVDIEDVYDDSGTTSRIVHRTAYTPLVGLIAGYYLSVKVQAITPAGTPLSADPVLISCDLRYNMYINK